MFETRNNSRYMVSVLKSLRTLKSRTLSKCEEIGEEPVLRGKRKEEGRHGGRGKASNSYGSGPHKHEEEEM